MKRLTKKQIEEKAKLAVSLNKAKQDLESALNDYNSKLADLQAPVEAALEKYNEAIDDANCFRGEVFTDQNDYAGERSEKWAESDAGQNYHAWMSDWETELTQEELELPGEIEMPPCEAVDNFENLTDEPA